MKLPISLFLLAAVVQAAKHGKEKGRASSPTIKRELFEGNFGQKTKLSATTETVTENKLTDEFKEAFYDPSATHHHIFGARLPQITKISDLLTGQGPPFDVAVNNHLYAPVSAYNTRLSSPIFEVQSPAATKNIFEGPKLYKPKLFGPEDLPANKDAAFHHPELFSFKQNDHVGADSFSRPDLTPNYLQEPYLHSNPFSQSLNPHLLPIFGGKPFAPSQDVPIQFYQQPQQPIRYVPVQQSNQNEKSNEQSKKSSNPEKEPPKSEPIKKPAQGFPSIPQHQQSYHAHPNGALSYASFTHSLAQAHLNGQAEPRLQYQETSNIKQHAVPQFHQQPIYVPEAFHHHAQPQHIQAHKLASTGHQLQFVPVPKQYYHVPHNQQILQPHHGFQKFSEPQFASALQHHHNQLYLNPLRQHLLREIHQKSIEQVEPSQMSEVRQESLGQSSQAHQMTAQSNQLPETKPQKIADQSAERDVRIIPLHRYTPTPASITYDHSVKPLSSRPPVDTQRNPKYYQESAPDQLVQATTHQPETEHSPRTEEPESHHQKSTLAPLATSPSLHTSPVTLQSLSTLEPSLHVSSTPHPEIQLRQEESHSPATPRHSVQIQLQQLHELHSELKPQAPDHILQQQLPKQEQESPEQFQTLSTPQPIGSKKPDYEIEIASNVDHSKLPKDLRPVNTHHGEPPLQVQQTQLKDQDSNAHKEENEQHEKQNSPLTHNQLESEQNPPQPQNHLLLEHNHHELAQSHQRLADNHQQLAHHHQHLAQNQLLEEQGLQPEQFHEGEAIQSPHGPVSNLNNPFIDSESSVPGPFHAPIKAILQPQGFSHPEGFVSQPEFHPSHIHQSEFPPVQYFGNFAESIFGGLHH